MIRPKDEVRGEPQDIRVTNKQVEAPVLPETVEISKTVKTTEGLSAFGRICIVAIGTLIPPLGIGLSLGCMFGAWLTKGPSVGFKPIEDQKAQVKDDWRLTKSFCSALGNDVRNALYLPKGWDDLSQYQSLESLDFEKLESDVQEAAMTELAKMEQKHAVGKNEWKTLVRVLDTVGNVADFEHQDAQVFREVASELEYVGKQDDEQLNREIGELKEYLYDYALNLDEGGDLYNMTAEEVKDHIEKVKFSIIRLEKKLSSKQE